MSPCGSASGTSPTCAATALPKGGPPEAAHARPADGSGPPGHKPRVLLLYGSPRERSYSRLATEEAARLLEQFGAETRIFELSDLPFPDQVAKDDRPAIRELREHFMWSEGWSVFR